MRRQLPMGNRWSKALAALALFTVGYMPGFSLVARAGDPGAITAGFDPTLPPQFDMAKLLGKGTFTQSCNGGLQDAIQQGIQTATKLAKGDKIQAAQSAANLGFGINAICPGNSIGPSADSLSCTALAPGGLVSAKIFKAKMDAIDAAIGNVTCEKNKIAAVKSELSCMTSQADMLTQQISAMQAAYQQNIQKMQQDVAQIDQVIKDRETQESDVANKLGGQGAGGSMGAAGLLDIRKRLQDGITATVPDAIQQLKNKMTQTDTAKAAFEEQVENRKMVLTNKCFDSPRQQSWKCTPDGPMVSAREYVLCRFEQNNNGLDTKSGNKNRSNEVAQINAANKKNSLESILGQIFSQTPQKTQVPGAAGAPPATDPDAAAPMLMTVEQIEAKYGDALATFDGQGVPVHDFIMQQLGYCYQTAEQTVNREKNLKSSPVGAKKIEFEMAVDNLKVEGNKLLEANSLVWTEAMAGLTGQHLPLTLNKCINQAGKTQVACLEDLQTNMQNLLQGNGIVGFVNMQVKGTDPKTAISFTCNGINGCITSLQNVQRNLAVEKTRLQTGKKQYVLQSRQSTDNFTKQAAAMMSAQGQALNNKLKNLNSVLSSMGIGGIRIRDVQGEPMKYDENGLPMPPNSAVQLIGGMMNPKMLDVSGSTFAESLEDVARGSQKLEEKLAPLSEAKEKLSLLKSSCAEERLVGAVKRVSDSLDLMTSGDCAWHDKFCTPANESVLATLSQTVSDLEPGLGLEEDDISNMDASLQAGIGSCPTMRAQKKANKDHEGGTKMDVGYVEPKTAVASCASITNRVKGDLNRVIGLQDAINSGAAR
jgi:hypothetical protein